MPNLPSTITVVAFALALTCTAAAGQDPAPQPKVDSAQAAALAKQWTDDLLQIDDPKKRDAAVAAIRAAIASQDATQQTAGVQAFLAGHDAAFDHASFRNVLLPLCKESTGPLQVQAFYALFNSKREPADQKLILDALATPSEAMQMSGSHLLLLFHDGHLEGPAAAIVLSLLGDERVRRQALSGMWGAVAAPELQARLLELAGQPQTRHEAIYFGLSTLANKQRDVIEFLIGVLQQPDTEDAQRALWGLGQGVVAEQHALVADALIKLFAARNSKPTRDTCLQHLRMYVGRAQVPALQKLADNAMLTSDEQKQLRELISVAETR